MRLHVHHAAARDGGGGRDGEIHRLEDEVHDARHGDDLATHQAELLVVVEHRVHVLDPDGVDGAVEDHPLAHARRVLRARAVDDREDAVRPLMADWIELAVQPARRDRLWVQARRRDLEPLFEERGLAEVLLVEEGEGLGEGAVCARLARKGQADDHEAMAHEEHLVHLEHLGDERVDGLEPLLLDDGEDGALEHVVIWRRQLHAGEEVRRDAVKEGHVVAQELGQVDVADRAEHEHGLRVVGERALEVARGREHRLDGAHAVVVVVLRRELLGAELVRLHDLLRKGAGDREAEGHERDLADEAVVGDHHRDRAEEHLEVVGQLGAAGVARVHRDEDRVGRVDREVSPFEDEALHARGDRALDREHLLRDDREHLEVDAVELVEARPRARGGDALEKLGHREVVEAVGAVEDDALLGERLGEVLGRLGLARAGGALGRATEGELDGAHQGAIAPVSQGRYHESERVAQVLPAVLDVRGDHLEVQVGPDHAVGLRRVVVEAELRDPVEVEARVDAHLAHHREHIAPVDVKGDHRTERDALHLVQGLLDQLDAPVELLGALGLVLAQPLVAAAVERLLRLERPEDLIDAEDDLAGPVEQPLEARALGVVGMALEELV